MRRKHIRMLNSLRKFIVLHNPDSSYPLISNQSKISFQIILFFFAMSSQSMFAQDRAEQHRLYKGSENIVLRHPKHESYWFQKDGMSRVRFFWRTMQDDNWVKTLQVAKDCEFRSGELLLEQKIDRPPYFWFTDTIGEICWRISSSYKGVDEVQSHHSKSHKVLIVVSPPTIKGPDLNERLYNFSWKSELQPLYYRFKLSNEVHFKQPLINEDVLKLNHQVESLISGNYYWKVGAKYVPNMPIVYSEVRDFHVNENSNGADVLPLSKVPSISEIEHNLSLGGTAIVSKEHEQTIYRARSASNHTVKPPLPSYPSQGEILQISKGDPVLIAWQSTSDASSHEIQITTSSSYDSILSSLTFNASYRFFPKESQYYWRVRSFNGAGAFSDWSPSQEFTINYSDQLIHLISPSDSATFTEYDIVFRWESFPGCQTYEIRISTTPDLSAATKAFVTSSQATSIEIDDDNLYFWNVSCIDEDLSARSETQSFIVQSDD